MQPQHHVRWQSQGHGSAALPAQPGQQQSQSTALSPTRALLLAANAGPASYYSPAGTQSHFTPLHGGAISAYLPSLSLLQPLSSPGASGGPATAGAQLHSSPYLASPFPARNHASAAGSSPAASLSHANQPTKKGNRQGRGNKGAGNGSRRAVAPSNASAANGSGAGSAGGLGGAPNRPRNLPGANSAFPSETAARRHALNPSAAHGHVSSPPTPTNYFPPPSQHQQQQQQFGQGRMFQRNKGLPPASASSSGPSGPSRPFSSGSSLSPMRRGGAPGGGSAPHSDGPSPPLGMRPHVVSRSLTASPTSETPAPQEHQQVQQPQQQQRGQQRTGPNGAAASPLARMGSPPLSPLIKPQQVVVDVRQDGSAAGSHVSPTSPKAAPKAAAAAAAAGSSPPAAETAAANGSSPVHPASSVVAAPAPVPAAPVAVLSNTTPDLLFLLSPTEHQALMSLLRARIDGKGAGAVLAVSDSTKALKIDSGVSPSLVATTATTGSAAGTPTGSTLGLPPHPQSPTSGSLRRPSFTSGAGSLLGPGAGAGETLLPPPPVGTPPSPSRPPPGLGLSPSSALLGPSALSGAASPPHGHGHGSPPMGPGGVGVGMAPAPAGPLVRVRSKSFSARVSLPRRPSLQSVREEGGAVSFGGMLLPPGLPLAHAHSSPQQLQVPQAQGQGQQAAASSAAGSEPQSESMEPVEVENEEEAQREQMLRAIAVASGASSSSPSPKHALPAGGAAAPSLSEYGATGGRGVGGLAGVGSAGGALNMLGLGVRRSSIPSLMPVATTSSPATLGLGLGTERPRAASLFVKRPLGGGGLITLPPNWSRQGSTVSATGSGGSVAGGGGGGADAGEESDCESSVIEPAPGTSLVPLRLPPSAQPQQGGGVPPTLHRARSAAAALNPPGSMGGTLGHVLALNSGGVAAASVPRGLIGAASMSERSRSAHVHGDDSCDDPHGANSGFGHPSFAPGPQVSAGGGGYGHGYGSGAAGGGRRNHPNRYTMAAPFSAAMATRLHHNERTHPHAHPQTQPQSAAGSFVSRAAAMATAPELDDAHNPGGPGFDPEREENGGQYWSLSHASLLLERIALERTLAPQFESYLTQALESIATARAIVAQRMAKRLALEEKLKSHPEQVADWLSEFAVGTAAGGAEPDGAVGGSSRSSSRGATARTITQPLTFHTPLATPKMSFSKPGSEPAPIGALVAASTPAAAAGAGAGAGTAHVSLPSSPLAATAPSLAAQQQQQPAQPQTALATLASSSTAVPAATAAAAAAAPTGTVVVVTPAPVAASDALVLSGAASGDDKEKEAAEAEDASSSLVVLDKFLLRSPIASVLERSTEWDFELFELEALSGGHSLLLLAMHLLRVTDMAAHFPALDVAKCFSFFREIESGYTSSIPYHNAAHGADVLQGMVYFMGTPLLRETLTPLDVLAGLTAAACHDYQHLGRNNAFMVATGHPLAVLYNDTSVMESHHASASWSVLLRPENDFLSTFRAEERAEFRASFLSAILHTDMSMHMKGVMEFEGSIKGKRSHGAWFSQASKEDRKLLLDMACHVSDLGNPAKPAHLAREWTRRVVEEFWSQGDAELEAGLKVSPMMDRKTAAVDAQQYGFIDFIVGPLFNSWADALEPAAIAPCLEHLSINKAYYKSRLPPPPQPQTPVAAPLTSPSSPASRKHSPSPSMASASSSLSSSSSSGLAIVSPTPRRGSTVAVLSPASKRNSINFPQLQLQLLPASSLIPTPWKNGGGLTREIMCWPMGSSMDAGNFTWRVSSATIRAPGGLFSPFPGRTRLLALVASPGSGGSLRLHVEGEARPRDMRTDDGVVQRFEGGLRVSAEVDQDSPDVQDVGLIFGAAIRVEAELRRLESGQSAKVELRSAPSRQQLLVVLLVGSAQVAFVPAAVGPARPQPHPISLITPLDCAFVPDMCADGTLDFVAQTNNTTLLVFHVAPA